MYFLFARRVRPEVVINSPVSVYRRVCFASEEDEEEGGMGVKVADPVNVPEGKEGITDVRVRWRAQVPLRHLKIVALVDIFYI